MLISTKAALSLLFPAKQNCLAMVMSIKIAIIPSVVLPTVSDDDPFNLNFVLIAFF
jgi:hypothetical protein